MVAAGAGGIGSMRRGDVTLEKLEAEPREARRGLWADPQPVPPWEWRRRCRGRPIACSLCRAPRAPGADTTRRGTTGVLLGGVGEGPG